MKRKTIKVQSTRNIKPPKKDRDLPVTKRLLDLKIQEVKGSVTDLRLEMKAGFARVDARFNQMESKFDTRFLEQDARLEARFLEQDAKFEAIQTQLIKMTVLLEDQNDRNRAALDGYVAVYERFHNTEERLGKLEKSVFGTKQR
ncbi:MAG: hypothetical protein H6623_07805 [Bdellovibrionaceae bacterium]|nr:hypothetical protein [Pseudobdellovibrionaceae bacterium]